MWRHMGKLYIRVHMGKMERGHMGEMDLSGEMDLRGEVGNIWARYGYNIGMICLK